MPQKTQTRINMNNMYRWTRHIYDASRKYYLLGRDHLIQNLKIEPQEIVCEIGCGTARNLIKMAKRYPHAYFYGIDASDEMLKTAHRSIQNSALKNTPKVYQALAQNFTPQTLFTLDKPVDKFVFSYALSIIPPWKESIDHALELLPKGGAIHIVDFGDQGGMPRWFRRFLFWWLGLFHVHNKPEVLEYLKFLSAKGVVSMSYQHLYRGYAYRAALIKL